MKRKKDLGTAELGVKSARVASFVAATQIVAIVISGLMLIFLARFLGPEQYGIYTLAFGVASFFGAFVVLDLSLYLNKFIPRMVARGERVELRHLLGTSFFVLVVISLAAILVGVLFSSLISTYVFHSASYTGLVDLSLATIVFTALMYLMYNALIAFRDGRGSSLMYIAGNMSIATASILLVLFGYGVTGAILGMIIGASIGIVVGACLMGKHSGMSLELEGIGKRISSMIEFTLPVALGTAIIPLAMSNFAILVLGIFSAPVIVGAFGVAYRIGTILSSVIGFVKAVLVQMFSSALEGKNARQSIAKLYNYSIYFGVLVAAPLAVFFITLSHAFVTTLFPSYRSSIYIPALSVSIIIGIVGVYASSLMVGIGKVREVLRYAALTGLIQLVLLLVLVPSLNAYGVILGVYFAGSVVANYLYVRYMRRNVRMHVELFGVYRVLFASVILALLLLPINLLQTTETIQLLVGVIAVVLLYPLLLGVTGAISSKEIEILHRIGEGAPVVGGLTGLLLSYTSLFVRG